MSPSGWLNDQLDLSRQDVEEWPEWLQESATDNRQDDCQISDANVVNLVKQADKNK